jgi:hypothetical protein
MATEWALASMEALRQRLHLQEGLRLNRLNPEPGM